MKFHCDRCKTKYSISDDRVRGKVLKIRCKNCSAVITVREPAAAREGPVSSPPPDAEAPPTQQDAAPGRAALAGAFQQAARAPSASQGGPAAAPVSLEAEWYVSVDGEQEGPFALEEARAWVRGKSVDDELYCWSEGYDDWLPVEKVSHFRGIRAPSRDDDTASDALGGADSPAGAGTSELTPKPLFAATMAAVAGDAPSDDMPLPGKASAAAPGIPGPGIPGPGIPGPGIPGPAIPGKVPTASVAPPIPARQPSESAPPIPARKPAESAPMPSPARQPSESAPPIPARKPAESAPMPSPERRPAALVPAGDDASLDFDIGEASRVVDLPTLLAQRGNAQSVSPARAPLPGMNASGASAASPSVGHGEAADIGRPLGRGSGPEPSLDDPNAGLAELMVPQTGSRKRSSALVPLVAASVVVMAIVGVLIYVVTGDDEKGGRVARGTVGGGGNLGYSFSDTRVRPGKGPVQPETEPEDTVTSRPKSKRNRHRDKRSVREPKVPNNPVAPTRDPNEVDLSGSRETGPTGPLDGDDLMRAYRKNQIAIKMCYERALKKNPLLKVPKTWVTITVGRNGRVSGVKIPTLAGQPLGTCLRSRISRWKFRETTEVFSSRFPVVFDR